ncbi:MAG: VCBS repeat-containing protein [Bacteroidales bacterium]
MKNYLLPLGFLLVLFACSNPQRFELMSSGHTGIDFKNTITETDSFHVISYEYIYNGAGVGVGDLNNDGLQDIVFAGNQVLSRIYLNKGNFEFEDITKKFEGLNNSQWFSGVTIADVNGDGWMDVYFTSTAGNHPLKCTNRLWINNGVKDGKYPTFNEMASKYGIDNQDQSVNAAFFDYDLDGDLDLYVLNNTVTQRMNTSYRTKITDGTATNNDKLYRNNGNNTFTDVTKEAGIVFEGFGLGLAIADFNKDGYPDIYVSNDYISNDLLYINQKNGTFKNEIRKYLSYQTKSSMGDDVADVNNDGFPDIMTLDMMPEEYSRKRQTINGFSYMFFINDAKYDYEHQFLRNMLHVNNGLLNGQLLPFSEVGQFAGIYQTEWSWSPLFADYDNDGDKDLLVSNGFPKDLTDKDWTRMKAQVYGFVGDEKYVINLAPALKVQNYAFENTGNLVFENRSKDWLPEFPSYSYGAAFVDLDNDGDLDYVVNNLNDEAFVLKNNTMEQSDGKAGYIRIKLTGKSPNTMGIGAKVEIWNKGKYQFNEHFNTRGYASTVDPIVHFGFPSADEVIDSIKITWPSSNLVTLLKNVKSNQLIEVKEIEATTSINNDITKENKDLLFIEDSLFNYVHEQKDVADFFLSQIIIPHKFSQIGPVLAQGDLNNDGKEDLLIGATNTLPTTAFIRKNNGFEQTDFEGLTNEKGCSESALVIDDFDKDGDNDVIIGSGGYEKKEDGYQHYLYENKNGKFSGIELPVPSFICSVIKTCDFNHDGYTDVFLGARVKKEMFPYSSNSYILVNNNGKLGVESFSKLDLGMVTDAVWSDYDKDGWEDLIVTREWNSIVIFKNNKGKEFVPQNIPGFDDFHGIWYSIAAGDFDQDGDDDYIVGNLGENNRFTINSQYPLNLYCIDLDMDGKIDPVSTAYWKNKDGKMTEYPINYLDELNAQTKFFQNLFSDYKTFSYTGMDRIFDESVLKRVDFKLFVNTPSSFIIWNDNAKFKWEKLSLPLQMSPITKMIIKDLNGDNYPDVILGGNDHTYDVSTGYYDANKGFVLLSNGKKQSFKILSPSQSGLLLQGMVTSLLYFEGDSPFVIAGINRGKVKSFKLNKK